MRNLININLRWFNSDPDIAAKNQIQPLVQVDT